MTGSSPVKSFTLIELLATIAIIALLVTGALFFTISYVSYAQKTSDQRTLTILNDTLNRYKTEGGGITGLTANATISRILTALQSTITYGGHGHNVMQSAVTYRGKSIGSTGSGAQYHFTRYNSYTLPGGDATGGTGGGVIAPTNVIVNGGFEAGILSGWSSSDPGSDVSIIFKPLYSPYIHSGTYACQIDSGGDSPDSNIDYISQSVTVPANSTLTFWYYMAGDSGFNLQVTFKGTQIFQNGTNGGYTQASVNMSSYAGQTGTLQFTWTDYGDNGAVILDDITLQ